MNIGLFIGLLLSIVSVSFAGVVVVSTRRRLRRAQQTLATSQHARQRILDAFDALKRLHADTAARSAAMVSAGDDPRLDAFDPVSGLLRERFVAVLIQQRVAAGRRRLHPVAVVAVEVDGMRGAMSYVVDGAMRILGAVVRTTLREADCACRIGDVTIIVALDDTAESGACIAVERIQAALGNAAGPAVTVSAGIACYPIHALEAPDLVARAGDALLAARAAGRSRVATASGHQPPGNRSSP
jgi:diguanylate cyclase (GGDEF)-like protein